MARPAHGGGRIWPAKYLGEIAKSEPDRPWSYQMGTESLGWHFEIADAVVDRMMVREVYRQKGPRGPERREELNAITLREQEIARAFQILRHILLGSIQ